MRAAKLWLSIFGSGFLIACALLVLTLFTRIPAGDLTRIARVSEHQFGWRELPPSIPLPTVQQAPLDQADVLVIGDSFSMSLAWQSEMVKAGYRVATTHWDWIGVPCQDFEAWLQGLGFKGRLVLLESIERALPARLAELQQCASTTHEQVRLMPTPTQSPAQPPAPFALNREAPLSSGLVTWLNTRKVESASETVTFTVNALNNQVRVSPVPDGCQQFSHRLCDKALFLQDDLTLPELKPADADAMQRFAQQFRNFAVGWMVIPNKTTVYLDPNRAHAFSRRADELHLGPDLFAAAQQGRHAMRDLYWPNDTHWSMQGHLYFGGLTREYVDAAIGRPVQAR